MVDQVFQEVRNDEAMVETKTLERCPKCECNVTDNVLVDKQGHSICPERGIRLNEMEES